jgi:hypothetical protein
VVASVWRATLLRSRSTVCVADCLLTQRLLLLALLWQEDGVDVWQDAAGCDGDASEQLVELLVVADGKLDVTWDDALLLVVAGGVACELEDLGSEVLEDCGEVHWGTSTDASGVAAGAEVAVDATNRELEAGLGGASGRLS